MNYVVTKAGLTQAHFNPHRIVHIKSKKIGVLSRLVQSCIIAYILGYVLIYNKGKISVLRTLIQAVIIMTAFVKLSSELFSSCLECFKLFEGYQQFDEVESVVESKVKGVIYTNYTDEELVGVPEKWKR